MSDAPVSHRRRAATPETPAATAPPRRRHLDTAAALRSLAIFGTAALAVLRFASPPTTLLAKPFESVLGGAVPSAAPSPTAYGTSGQVKVRFAMPGQSVEYPLEVAGNPDSLRYGWVSVDDTVDVAAARPLSGASVIAPEAPGFYHLALLKATERRIVSGLTVAVMVPFTQKIGAMLNGYRIGTYLAERLGGAHSLPEGFVQIDRDAVDLPLTTHLRLGDFIVHDEQQTWPRYAALSPRLLDKLELVISEVGRMHGEHARRVSIDGSEADLAVDVHSGFRSPSHNRAVKRSAQDSRHQFGDAADVTIDADGDGRFTLADTRLVAMAVEAVEAANPDLAGGMGLYTSRRYNTPYVHIDARGHKARWNG